MNRRTILILFFVFLSQSAIAGDGNDKKTVLILGDSLVAGYGVAREDAFPALVESLISQKHPVRVIAAGINGSTSATGPGRLKWHLKKETPDVLLLALGANDGLQGLDPSQMKQNLKATIEIAQTKGIKVLLAGMKLLPNLGPDYVKAYEAVFPEVAKETNTPLVPFLLEGVGGEPNLNLADGIHPNKEGHALIAKTVTQYLKELL